MTGGKRRALGAAAAAALVGIYLGVAAVAHLAPWHGTTPAAGTAAGTRAGTPAGTGTGTAAGTGAPSVPRPRVLLDLIPAVVKARGCAEGKLILGATAVRNCTGVSYGPGKADAVVSYYLFADGPALDRAYGGFLTAAKVPRGTGNCAGFRSFRAPCETGIQNAHVDPAMTGRAVEFTHAGDADIVSCDQQRDVLVYATARDGQALLSWWLDPHRWLVTG